MRSESATAVASLGLQSLIDLIAEVTRFPVDLLKPDVDLEEEFGIDSLKRAEIAAVIGERFELSTPQLQTLSGAKSIRALWQQLDEVPKPAALSPKPSPAPVGLRRVAASGAVAKETHAPMQDPNGILDKVRALVGPIAPRAVSRPFEGKIALVTGSGHGLGRVTALELGQRGATVVVNSFHDRESGGQTAQLIREQGGQAEHIWGSVAHKDQLDQLFDQIRDRFGRLDFYIHNASNGIFAKLADVREDDWLKSFRTNVIGFHHGAQRAAELMRTAGGGKILSLSAVYENVTMDYFGVQGPVKAALESLTRFVAKELLADNIQVNCLSLGALEGAVMERYPEAERIIALTEERSQGRRRCREEEAARVQMFLLSPEADSITGSVIRVDRGMSIA